MTKKILLSLAVLLIAIQFIRIDKQNSEIEQHKDFINLSKPPKDIQLLLVNACYDCHSNTTTYPWYAEIAPVSWWLKHHVDDGRKHLNFSTWADYTEKKQIHKLEEAYEEVTEGKMPLSSYTFMHHKAKLSALETEKLSYWINEELKKYKNQISSDQ